MMRGYVDGLRSYDEVDILFNNIYPNQVIGKSTVWGTVQRYEVSHNVKNLLNTEDQNQPLTRKQS